MKNVDIKDAAASDMGALLGFNDEQRFELVEKVKQIMLDAKSEAETCQMIGEAATNFNEYTMMMFEFGQWIGLVHGHAHPQCAEKAAKTFGHSGLPTDVIQALAQLIAGKSMGDNPRAQIIKIGKMGEE